MKTPLKIFLKILPDLFQNLSDIMAWKYPLSDINFTQEEQEAVQSVLESQWLTMGSRTQEFEKAIASYLDVKHALAVTNCTAALHIACLALGLGPGDEVIVPSLTFVASANAIRYTGAQPIFADITSTTDLNISPQSIERCITNHTRAIMVVHYGGYPCNMPQILALARKNNLVVIEDAAHAIGSKLQDRALGTWGEIGCFSFFSNKNLTTGEGGMLVTNRDDLAEKLRLLRSHGMTSLTWDRHRGHAWSYDVIELGYNYRIDEIRAALGIVQLGKLEEYNLQRRYLTRVYIDLLQELVPAITIPFTNHHGISSAHIMPVLLPQGYDRFCIMDHLKSKGIQTSIHYPPIHQFTAYQANQRTRKLSLPATEEVATREITLPLFPVLKEEDIQSIVCAIRDGLQAIHLSNSEK
jgi:dTDP-4-amino-4,6-dideoxygalactose transaminase